MKKNWNVIDLCFFLCVNACIFLVDFLTLNNFTALMLNYCSWRNTLSHKIFQQNFVLHDYFFAIIFAKLKVVFIAGGFHRRKHKSCWCLHNGGRQIQLSKSDSFPNLPQTATRNIPTVRETCWWLDAFTGAFLSQCTNDWQLCVSCGAKKGRDAVFKTSKTGLWFSDPADLLSHGFHLPLLFIFLERNSEKHSVLIMLLFSFYHMYF